MLRMKIEKKKKNIIIETGLPCSLQSTRALVQLLCLTTVSPITHLYYIIAETKQVVWAEGEEKNITQEVVCSSNH